MRRSCGRGLLLSTGVASLRAIDTGCGAPAAIAKEDRGEFLVVKGSIAILIVVVENALAVLKACLIEGMAYRFLDDDANLLNGAVELVEVDSALVVDVEELEALLQETFLPLVLGALLGDLGPEVDLKSMIH